MVEVGLNSLPGQGSSCPNSVFDVEIPNPLTVDGVTFTDPGCLASILCGCEQGGNLLILNNGSTLDFPGSGGAALIALEGMGEVPFVIDAEDGEGATLRAFGQTISNGVRYIGFSSPSGIQQLRLIETPINDFALLEVWYEADQYPLAQN